MPGWRVGMCLSNPQFIQWILKVQSNIESGTFRGIQLAAAEALNNNDEAWHREFNIDSYKRRRQWAEKIMDVLGCTYDKNQVGMFLWGKIPADVQNVEDLTERVLHEARVFRVEFYSHWLFLQMPKAMKQGCTYKVAIPAGIGSDKTEASIRFDVWNNQSEAVHINIIGYSPLETIHAADLYQWLGDGGQRDYKQLEGKGVWLYNVNTKKKQKVGTVKFWQPASAAAKEAGGKSLIGTDVWNIDFSANKPGCYRLVVEDVGCSMDFEVKNDIYYEPYRYSVRGYYYMRLGEPINTDKVFPAPRQPQFIPETDPKGFTV